jgi:predicted ATPase
VDESILQQGLNQLVAAELLYQRGTPPQATYLFKHALIQDTAYQSLLKSKRQQLHQQIAQVLEQRFPETKDTQPELLAHHYTEAGLIAHAIPYWQQAGQHAVQRSANTEAVSHLMTAFELLKTRPDTSERAEQELVLQITIGPAWMAVKGYAAPEVERAYSRARDLCQQIDETSQLFTVLRGLWIFYQVRAELRTARELGEQLLQLAQDAQDPSLLLEAHYTLGETLYYLGEFTSAYAHTKQGIALYDPQQHRSHAFFYGVDPGMLCLIRAALVLWLFGYPEQAVKRSQEALALAQELAHSNTLAAILAFASWFYQLCREEQRAKDQVEAVITLSTEQGLPFWLAVGESCHGWLLAEQGQAEEGVAQIRRGLADYRATEAEIHWRIQSLVALAEVCLKVGRTEEGLSTLAEAIDVMNSHEERWLEAELYRLKGALTLQSKASLRQVSDKSQASQDQSEDTDPRPLTPDPQGEAEACFHKAIEIAQKQQAKSLELRATMSLARLWQQQGRQGEAHRILYEVYNWFTEGFDTKDLQEAKALLESLSL